MAGIRTRWAPALAGLAALVASAGLIAAAWAWAKPDASDPFFANGEIPRLKIEISPEELNKLRADQRAYVRCKVIENDQKEYREVGVKLKGAAGSFRNFDDKPALTLNFDKYLRDQTFHDMEKIHLNNSVQDPSYLSELICAELNLAAGVPATRATHARVWLNGRDVGFYVLKQGFDDPFLKRHFPSSKGNLYDGGFLQEIDAKLEKDSGKGPDDHSDLQALVAACREGDPAKRAQRVSELLDVEKFISFMALELMGCHWDGYCQNRNNYRVYFDPDTKKAHFFPHGMDQMFGDTNFGVLHTPGALAANVVMQNPEWRGRYRDRLHELVPLFNPEKLHKRIDEVQARIQPVLKQMNEGFARDQENHARGLKDRLTARYNNLLQQDAQVELRPLKFSPQGVATLERWYPKLETADAKLVEETLPGQPRTWAIYSGPGGRCVASWRTKALLPAGNYKLVAKARTQDLAALADSSGTGAGVRISGGQRTNKLEGTTGWQVVEHAFQVGGAQEVELVAELRATKGAVWFEAASLQLVRQP